jgi:alpha-tubulin suppressor-like RCC1 family protein
MSETRRRGVWNLQEVRDQILDDDWEKTFQIFAWGSNSYGILGQNNTIAYSSPVQIPGTTWNLIDTSGTNSLATKTDGTLWAWGRNGSGQLGQSNTYNYSSPRQIPGNTWSSIGAGSNHSLATKTDGTLWAWGANGSGNLGQSNTTPRSSPVQIPGNTWTSAVAGETFSAATKTYPGNPDIKELWTWGSNTFGVLGQNDTNTFFISSPRQVPGNKWSSVIGPRRTGYHLLATKTDNTLWAWGYNVSGQLGQSDTTSRSSPVQIPGNTWSSISAGQAQVLATKTDGTLWSWGLNTQGQLGQNNTINRSSPVQVPGTTWSSISANYHSLATKTDGTLWVWGPGGNGQLGQSNTTPRSSPVQIPGVTWSKVTTGASSSFAIKTPQI